MSWDSKIKNKYYEKETCSQCSQKADHKRSAMGEKSSPRILSLVRRIMNTCESLGEEEMRAVVDQYARKIMNSGYTKDQTIKIRISEIK